MEGAAQSGLEAVKHFFDNGGMRRNTCGCCNELKSPSQTRTVAIEEGGPWVVRLKKRLSWGYTTFGECSSDVIDRTKQHYYSTVPALGNIPLAPNGVVVGGDDSVKVNLCIRCYDSLHRGKPDAVVPPPPLAICNNWVVIPLPPSIIAMNPNWVEHSVTALAQVALKYEICGNSRRKLLSHSLLFRSERPAADKLPRTLTSNEYFVVFAKLTDDEATVQRKRRLLVRREVQTSSVPSAEQTCRCTVIFRRTMTSFQATAASAFSGKIRTMTAKTARLSPMFLSHLNALEQFSTSEMSRW